jgi:hypothetical protein
MVFRRRRGEKPPQRGQVRHCEDPRNRSDGSGGHHFVILMENNAGIWIGAVIETRPAKPVYTFAEPRIATAAGVDLGSGIQLPVARIPAARIGYVKGSVAGVTLARIEAAIAAALVPLPAAPEAEAEAEPRESSSASQPAKSPS